MKQMSYSGYHTGRRVVSALATIVFWLLLWGLNGYFTVLATTTFGQSLLDGEYPQWVAGAAALIGGLLTVPWAMWLLHVILSCIEGNAWKDIWRAGPTFLVVLLLDIYTTGIGLSALFVGAGWFEGYLWVAYLFAILLAVLPEPMIVRELQQIGIIDRPSRVYQHTI